MAVKQKPASKIILGIDPGTVVMGIAIVRVEDKKISLIYLDSIQMQWQRDLFERLHLIYNRLVELIQQYRPDELAIEAPFYGKNVQSMLKLGRAQGVAITCALQFDMPVHEYSPKKVKQSITGNGNASKESVLIMLERIMELTERPRKFDASDALAVALCHHYQMQSPLAGLGSKGKGWEEYIRKNPDKVQGL